ncbi:MAG: DUF58 domain-containing protein [Alloprevotella sp.]|nr:DUF58 domain-containing protein [Alloprevotella sp.]
MDTQELLRRVRRIEIKTRALTNDIFAGEYHSAFKGHGMSFAEVREYQPGDDVRDIDWNVTARTARPHVKVYEEERELTVVLLVDVSRSLVFGTQQRTLRELVAELAATIAFSAIQNNDKIGVIFFSDRIEKFIPPKKGRRHILYIIRELLEFRPESERTDIRVGVEYLVRALRKRCISFLISDFVDKGDFSHELNIAARKHDVVALRLYDRRMAVLPDVGLMKITDAETGHEQYVDTSSKRVRDAHRAWWQRESERLREVFSRSGVDTADIATDGDYVTALRRLFAERSH